MPSHGLSRRAIFCAPDCPAPRRRHACPTAAAGLQSRDSDAISCGATCAKALSLELGPVQLLLGKRLRLALLKAAVRPPGAHRQDEDNRVAPKDHGSAVGTRKQ